MEKLEYYGDPKRRPATSPDWSGWDKHDPRYDPRLYQPDDRLVSAVNVALLLGRPLLLTGDPGTGKTQLASSLAWELGLSRPLVFSTKSTSTSRDLLYQYDAVGHFRQSQIASLNKEARVEDQLVSPLGFIVWSALGEAIIRSNALDEVSKTFGQKVELAFDERLVVLIDEIDKAPRDFPNDLLNEIERLNFEVPEYGNRSIQANLNKRPIVVLTSNSERNLPDAFLRRCIFHHISFPDNVRLISILKNHLGDFVRNSSDPLISDALRFFSFLRDEIKPALEKRPATAELIDWLTVLKRRQADPKKSLYDQKMVNDESLGALIKTQKDMQNVLSLMEKGDWSTRAGGRK